MKEYYLDLHTDECLARRNRPRDKTDYFDGFRHFCDHNPERFLFYLNGEFYIICYHTCITYGNDYDVKIALIKRTIEKHKVYELYDIDKGWDVNGALRNFRIRNESLRKFTKEINYIYSNAAGKLYAITTTVKYIDAICDQDKLDANYREAKEYLKNTHEYLLDDLDELHRHNYLMCGTPAEHVKSIDHLVKLINQKTK